MPFSLKNKKVLIAGGAGLLGIALTKRLIASGASVVSSCFLREPPSDLKIYYKKFDFTKPEDCYEATKDQDYVIISAVVSSGVLGAKNSPTAMILPNLEIVARLLEACCQNQVKKIVWISSSTVYQEAAYPIGEYQLDLNKAPYELYQGVGWVYRYLEQLARYYYQKLNLEIGIIRTSNIYGPYDRFDDLKSHVIPALIKRAIAKETPFTVWGDGGTIRDFVYVDDLVEGVLRVLEGYCIAKPVNISNGNPVSINELVGTVLSSCNHLISPEFDLTKPSAVPYRVLNNAMADKLLGRIEKTPLSEGIRRTVDWYTSNLSRE